MQHYSETYVYISICCIYMRQTQRVDIDMNQKLISDYIDFCTVHFIYRVKLQSLTDTVISGESNQTRIDMSVHTQDRESRCMMVIERDIYFPYPVAFRLHRESIISCVEVAYTYVSFFSFGFFVHSLFMGMLGANHVVIYRKICFYVTFFTI